MVIWGVFDFSQNLPAKPSKAIFLCLIAEPQLGATLPASIFPSPGSGQTLFLLVFP
jgi:hypothetical protein